MKCRFILIFSAMILFLLSGCNMAKDVNTAKSAVIEFHALLDKADFDGIYAASSSKFKENTEQKRMVTFLEAIHRKLGIVQQSSLVTQQTHFSPLESIITLTYKTKFTEGVGLETFMYSIDKDAAELLAYNISSEDLIIK